MYENHRNLAIFRAIPALYYGRMKYAEEVRDAARALYLKFNTPKEIAASLGLPVRTVYNWAIRGKWNEMLPAESVELAIARRVERLTNKDGKNELELEELRFLVSQHVKLMVQKNKHAERMEEIRAMVNTGGAANDGWQGGGEEGDGEGGKKRKRPRKNDVSELTKEIFDEKAAGHLFEYQQYVREHSDELFRFILKGRQEGFTYYFAWEGFEKAVLTGKNQIFFSASKPQAEVFRFYILSIAQQFFGIELKGNPIRLSNGAILRFLATNPNTAQSYSGDLYGDEVFWIPKFARLHEVASAMATHDEFRITYFSTPSAKTHQAYKLWTGDEWKGDDPKRKAAEFPTNKELRKGGQVCPDGIWRYVITMEDACAKGLSAKVNIEKLRNRYSATAFSMLYMCEFTDSRDAVFKFSDLEKCEVEFGIWQDFDPTALRPFGNREVWGGFDPSRTGDNSTFVIVAPPVDPKEKFRVLAVYQWVGLNFTWQVKQIEELMKRYRFTHIGIDITGIGRGVHDQLIRSAPREVMGINYSVDNKNKLVLKMIDLVERRRIQWVKDAVDEVAKERVDIPLAFMAIRRVMTASQNAMTFAAERSETTGHADVFFAISHAVCNEPLDYEYDRPSVWGFSEAA